MNSVVPLFGDSKFDAEATQAIGNAYDIACRSLHPKGRLPVIQELLAGRFKPRSTVSVIPSDLQ